MSEPQVLPHTLEVCPDTTTVLRNCEKCGVEFKPVKRQRFCSNGCKQAAYRASPAYQARLYKKRCERWAPRNEKFQRRNRARSLGFDGRYGGPLNSSAR
jgi:hypothetical protein